MLKKSIFGLVATAFVSFLVMSLPGCGGGGGGGGNVGNIPGVSEFSGGGGGGAGGGGCTTCVSFNVNSATGNNANAVLGLAPFKTIASAVQYASAVAITSGANINVASGVYNAASGEVFPLRPTNGENLIGTGSVLVSGTGIYTFSAGGDMAGILSNYAMVFAPGVTGSMTGISLSGSVETICADNATVTLTNNTFSGSTNVAVAAVNGAKLTLNGNTINNGVQGGIIIVDTTTKVVARGNVIPNPSQHGVIVGFTTAIPATAVDLGTAASPGNNTILSGATGVGLLENNVTAGGTIQAVGNTWHPSIQGADASGHYAASLIAAASGVAVGGTNYNNSTAAIQF